MHIQTNKNTPMKFFTVTVQGIYGNYTLKFADFLAH